VIRDLAVLLILAGLAAFAGAQGQKPPLTAAQQQQLFQKNRTMVQALVDSSLEISKSNDFVQRSRSYRKVAMQLQRELDDAAGDTDAGRIVELGKHLDTVLRQGLAPSLRAAHQQIGPGGTDRQNLLDMRNSTVELVDRLQNKARNKWADTPEVRQVIESLESTKKDLSNSVDP